MLFRMKYLLLIGRRSVCGLSSVFFLLSLSIASPVTKILHPWRAAPTIVAHGGDFEVWIQNGTGTTIDSIVLEGPYNRIRVSIQREAEGQFPIDPYTAVSADRKVTVRVPVGAPEELYDLVLHTPERLERSLRAVKVVNAYRPRHRFIHISDPHISRQWVGTPENGYAKELELFDRFVDIANIIDPDFIVVTGDLIHDYTRLEADSLGWGGITHTAANELPGADEKFRNYYEGAYGLKGISGLHAPAFSIAGNHDFYGVAPDDHLAKATQWNQLNGRRVYGLPYAGTRILFMDDYLGDPVVDVPASSPLSGLQGKVLRHFLDTAGPGKIRILAQHRPDRIDTAFTQEHGIQLVLNGHNHRPYHEFLGAQNLLNIRPGSIARSGSVSEWEQVLGFFRLFTVDGERFTFTEALRIADNPVAPYEAMKPKLTLGFERPNDGSVTENIAEITNRFPIAFERCKVRFVMPKGRYTVSEGEIFQTIENQQITVVDVHVDVKAGEKKTIGIKPW